MDLMATIPNGAANDWSARFQARRLIDPVLSIGAVGFMAYGAFWPIFDRLPGRGIQILTLVAIATTLGAGFALPRGSRPAFHLLWVALGIAAGLGIVGIFSVGFLYLIAAILIALTIRATPNRSSIELRFDWRYVLGFHVGFILVFVALFL